MTSTAILGIAFLLVGMAAAFLMMHLWGYPFDEVRQKSEAPRSLELLHRLLGYVYVILYVVIMFRMVPRLWMYEDELSGRSVVHAALGAAIGAVLLVKLAIIRFFPYFKRYLHVFGITLLCLTLACLAFPLTIAFREWYLSREANTATGRTMTHQRLAAVAGIGAAEAAVLATTDGLAAGREAFLTHCVQCHDTRRILSEVHPADGWFKTVSRMAEESRAPGYLVIDAQMTRSITAYLTAIRGEDAAPVPVAAAPVPRPSPTQNSTATEAPAVSVPPSQFPAATPPAGDAPVGAKTSGGAAVDVAAVEALLAQHCAKCHTGARAKKGMVLESAETAIASGAVTPGDVQGSILLRAVRGETDMQMPLNGAPLAADEIALLEAWVASLGNQSSSVPPASGIAPPKAVAAATPKATPRPTATPRVPPRANEVVRYDHIEPIIAANCTSCHAAKGMMGPPPEGLILTSHEAIFSSSERPVVLPGLPAASAMLRHIRGVETPRMPFDGPPWLSDEETKLIERWIRDGARDAAGNPGPVNVGQEVRLTGTLTSRWVVDGVPFRVTGNTEMRDVSVGARVEFRGAIASDGSLVAERVRGR